jgi:hypothetical protein
MWSLPDIQRLNECAAQNARKLKGEAARKRKPQCQHYNCTERAEVSHLVYDIFSDDAKDVLHLCEQHDGYSGDPAEGYFTCEECGRVNVENYTWERYQTELDGRSVCLKCAAEIYFADESHWFDPQDVIDVVLDPGNEHLFADGTLNVAKCRHVLAVKQPLPSGVAFLDNAEFDSMNGRQISGDDLVELIRRIPAGEKFCPVLDAAYQFAVSIGIYLHAENGPGRLTNRRRINISPTKGNQKLVS